MSRMPGSSSSYSRGSVPPGTIFSSDLAAGNEPVPGYILERELGAGAMGKVWVASTSDAFEAKKAIKFIDLRNRGGGKEWKALKVVKERGLSHPNLLKLINYWLKDADGRIIPRSEEPLDQAQAKAAGLSESRVYTLSSSIPRSLSGTDADTNPERGTRAVADSRVPQPPPLPIPLPPPLPQPLVPPPTSRNAATRVGHGTVSDLGAPLEATQSLLKPTSSTVATSIGTVRQAVELIVAMELGDKTLEARLKECQADGLTGIPQHELFEQMEQSARALDYLDRQEIIHRDVKPANILLVDSVTKVSDYGLVVGSNDDLSNTSVACSPVYASPEAIGNDPVQGKSDQYSLAVTYIELLTGLLPYHYKDRRDGTKTLDQPDVFSAKTTGNYDLSRISNRKARVVLKKALANKPEDRYGSCIEFVKALEKAEQGGALWKPLVGIAAALLLLIGSGVGLSLTMGWLTIPWHSLITQQADIQADIAKLANDLTLISRDDPQAVAQLEYRLDKLEKGVDYLESKESDETKSDIDTVAPLRASLQLVRLRIAAAKGEPFSTPSDIKNFLNEEQLKIADYLELLALHAEYKGDRKKWMDIVQPRLKIVETHKTSLESLLGSWEFRNGLPAALSDFDLKLVEARGKRLSGQHEEARRILGGLESAFPESAAAVAFRLEKLQANLADMAFDHVQLDREAKALESEAQSPALRDRFSPSDHQTLAAVRLLVATHKGNAVKALDERLFVQLMEAVDWQKYEDPNRLRGGEIEDLGRIRREMASLLEHWQSLPQIEQFSKIWPSLPDRVMLLKPLAERFERLADASAAALERAKQEYSDLAIKLKLADVAEPGSKYHPESVLARLEMRSRNVAQNDALDELRRYIQHDKDLADAEKCKAILARLELHGTAIKQQKDLALLQAELKILTAKSPRESEREISDLLREAKRLRLADLNAEFDDYASYLQSQINTLAGKLPASKPEEIWPKPPLTAAWQTERRKRLAHDTLVNLGIESLPLKGIESLATFASLSTDSVTMSNAYLERCLDIDPGNDRIKGLQVIVRTIRANESAIKNPQSVDDSTWRKILNDLPKAQEPLLHAMTLEYVYALSASYLKVRTPQETQRALTCFSRLLEDDSVFKHDDRPDVIRDGNLLDSIVNRGLYLIQEKSPDSESDRKKAAAIWAARGRILERNDTLVESAESDVEFSDSYSRAIYKANLAFKNALDLNRTLKNASAFARTFLEMPHECFDAKAHLDELSQLISEFDPKGISTDPGLLLVGGWTKFKQAEIKLNWATIAEDVADALRRFELMETAIQQDDVFNIRTIGLVNAANTHVWAAFFQPNLKTQLAGRTQQQHLERARDLAEQAKQYKSRRLIEDAHIVQGNAFEDLAYKCKLDWNLNYGLAVNAFESAAQAAKQNNQSRSSAHALMCKGRSQLRWAVEIRENQANANRRLELLKGATETLASARATAANEKSIYLPEIVFWQAHTIREIALHGPGRLDGNSSDLDQYSLKRLKERSQSVANPQSAVDLVRELDERFASWNEARKLFIAATEDTSQPKLNRVTFLTDGAECCWDLHDNLNGMQQVTPLARDQATMEEMLHTAQSFASDLLNEHVAFLSVQLGSKALGVLAEIENKRSGKAAAISLIRGKGKDLALKPEELWQWEIGRLLFKYAFDQSTIDDAQNIVEQLSDPSQKKQAKAYKLKAEATVAMLQLFGQPIDRQTVENLSNVLGKFEIAEAELLAACDPATLAQLRRLRYETKLNEVINGRFVRQLNTSDVARMKEALERFYEFHSDMIKIANRRILEVELETPLKDPSKRIARAFYGLYKLRYFLNETSPQDENFLNNRTRLEKFERMFLEVKQLN